MLVAFGLANANAAFASTPSTKTWTFGSYNIGAYDYNNYNLTINGSDTPANQVWSPTNDANAGGTKYWADLYDSSGGKRSTQIINRLTDSMTFGSDTVQADVLAVQEATGSSAGNAWSGTPGGASSNGTFPTTANSTLSTQRQNLSDRMSALNYSEGVPYSAYDKTGDTITVNGASTTRPVAKATDVFYNTSTLTPLTEGTDLSQDIINPSYKSGYLSALGTSFTSSADVNKEKTFPWVILRTTGANSDLPNRTIVFGAVHSIVPHNYTTTAQNTPGLVDFYNSEVMRGFAAHLNAIAAETSTNGVAHASGIPVVIAGDMNAYYTTTTKSSGTFPSGSATSKSVPKLLKDYGYRDARAQWFEETAPCSSSNSSCATYHTINSPSGSAYDYIFTRWANGTDSKTANVGGFQTISDSKLWSDHRMIAARISFIAP